MLVYIASLPHSGSTLLSMLLAKHPRILALGEVRLQVNRIRRDQAKAREGVCGCGDRIRDCPLWSRFMAERSVQAAPVDDLRLVTRIASDLYGPATLLVDASKIREPIEELAADGQQSVRVIHLSRDYRSWIVSAADIRRRKGKRTNPAWLFGLANARRWVRENRKLERSISASGFPAMRLGYEELVLADSRVWPLLWNFLGIADCGAPRDISDARNHIFSGNRMREDASRRAVSYDDRWFRRRDWRVASALLPNLRALNRRWTYSHGFCGQGTKASIEKLAASHGFEP